MLSFMMMYSCLHNGAVVPMQVNAMQVNAMQGNMVFARARYRPCFCGGKIKKVAVDKADVWEYDGEEKCQHDHPYGTDLKYVKECTVKYQCDKCKRAYKKTEYRYKVECHGYDG